MIKSDKVFFGGIISGLIIVRLFPDKWYLGLVPMLSHFIIYGVLNRKPIKRC